MGLKLISYFSKWTCVERLPRCSQSVGYLRKVGPPFEAVLILLATFITGCQPDANIAEHVELVADFENVGPAATFELRFEQAIVGRNQLGIPLTNSPLLITPPIAGSFTWLSTRSGTFTPTEALAMDTRYELALARGLPNVEGQPVRAKLRKTLRTPPFSLTRFLPMQASTNASAKPEVKLVFNAAVQAAAANRFLEFRDSKGRQVVADVRQGALDEVPTSYEFGASVSLRTWNQQFADQQPHRGWYRPSPGGPTDPATNVAPNFLIVAPRQPLPIGQGWRLIIKPGLPAAEGGLRLRESQVLPIGDVTPFALVSIAGRNIINHLPSMTLEFSKALNQALTNQTAKCISVEPCPTNLTMEVRGSALVLIGSFKSDTQYTLTIRAGLPAAEPFALAEPQVLKGTVPRIEPRLYFPAFSGEQLAQGKRTFQLLAVNVPKLHIRAKLLDPQTAIYALRGYGSYFRTWNERLDWDEPLKRIEYSLIPGRTVFNQETPGSLQSDVATNLTFSWDTILSGRKTGVVFLDAERASDSLSGEERLGTQALIQLTDLGVVWKDAPLQVQAFVFSHSTGQPVSGAAVRLLSEENELLCETSTGNDGLAQFSGPFNAQWLAVQKGEDFHSVELRQHSLSIHAFGLPFNEFNGDEDLRRVLLFSDRELYRPGETLQFKAIVRDWSDRGLTIPSGLAGTLVCRDARERKLFETNMDFSPLGSCSAAVPLNSETRGMHACVLRLGSREYVHPFQVQDFQPSAFEISLQTKPEYGPDEPIAASLSAHYYFGKPITQAQVKWSLEAQDTQFRTGVVEGFSFGRSAFESAFGRGPSLFSRNGQEKLTSMTNCVIAPEVPINGVAPQPRTASLLVEVTDINQQTLSRQVEFVRHSSAFYLGLKQAGQVQGAGKELPLEIVALSKDGKLWPQPVTAQVRLQRIEWQPVRLQGAGRSVRFRNEAVFTDVAERVVEVSPVSMPDKVDQDIHGTTVSGLIASQAGQYLIEATATDPAGHPVISSLDLVLGAQERLAWDYRNDAQMTLKPDRSMYAPGETAQILVEAPISGVALVTVEREKVLRSFTTRLEGNARIIQVPIEPGDVPNVFASVTLLRGSEACPREIKEPEFRVGNCQLTVEELRNHLAVKVSSPATNYLPGQLVTARVEVKDNLGAAVTNAEVTLYAVDEGVLSLSGTAVPDPYAFFYAARALRVRSGISLPNLVEEDPGELRFGNKGYLGGGGGAERLRKNFLACAFWQASLLTDWHGEVQAAFPAPDGVTRYRLVAVVHTPENRFGAAQSAFQVFKPLLVEPALPRFASVNDRLLARAVVLNQTDQSGEMEVTLQLDGHARSTGASPVLAQKVTVTANSSAAVEFPVEFVETGVAKWVWKAHFADEPRGDFTDAVQSTLDVGYPAPLLRQVLLAKTQGTEVDLLSGANPQLVTGHGAVTVQLANTRLIGLSEAVAALLQYPYGCAEQTSSSLLPWIVLRDRDHCRAMLTCGGGRDSEKAIRAGIARLFSMQTQSGGLGYWPNEREPMFWASAYGGLVLALAQRHGVEFPREDFGRLLDYLSTQLRSNNSAAVHPDHLCLAAYALALAGRAEPAYHEKLFQQRERLNLEGRALLALAISESRGSHQMAIELLTRAPILPRSPEDPFSCLAREQAIRLLACIVVQPHDGRIDKLVTKLMNEQKEGQWTTTQGNAWAIFALAEYGRRIEGVPEACEGELQSGHQRIAFRLEGTNNIYSLKLPLGQDESTPTLKLTKTKGTVFASTTLATRPRIAYQPRQDKGFNLQRGYQRLNDADEVQEPKNLHVGDRVLVTLRLEVRQPARFVAVDDALPSNLEAINPEFKGYQTRRVALPMASTFEQGDYWRSDFQEIRSDRVLSFANEVAPGHYILRYLARVRAAAIATAPAAKIEEMYHPDRYGLSQTQVLSSQPMQ